MLTIKISNIYFWVRNFATSVWILPSLSRTSCSSFWIFCSKIYLQAHQQIYTYIYMTPHGISTWIVSFCSSTMLFFSCSSAWRSDKAFSDLDILMQKQVKTSVHGFPFGTMYLPKANVEALGGLTSTEERGCALFSFIYESRLSFSSASRSSDRLWPVGVSSSLLGDISSLSPDPCESFNILLRFNR